MTKRALNGVRQAAAAVLVLTATEAGAVTSKSFKYPSPKTGYLQIPAVAMTFDGDNATPTFEVSWPNGSLSGNSCFNAPVDLPQGSTIVALTYIHTGPVGFQMFRTDMATGASNYLANFVATAAMTRTVESLTLPTPVKVNNATTFYGLGVCLDIGEIFHGARIKYTYTNAGD